MEETDEEEKGEMRVVVVAVVIEKVGQVLDLQQEGVARVGVLQGPIRIMYLFRHHL